MEEGIYISGADPYDEIPEEEVNPIEYINKTMSEQPEDNMLDEFLYNQSISSPKEMPSAMDYREWLVKKYHSENELKEYKIYIDLVRKELREWYNKNYKNRSNENTTREESESTK